jgi:hypothetical protein
MPRKLPIRDPIAAHQRKAVAVRRVGLDAQCACGESRPEALLSGRNPAICAACDRTQRGKTTLDRHHVAGKSNSPVTIPIPANDHRARLSADQHDWPRQTLENPNGSPLLVAAASVRGFADTLFYLIEEFLLWIPEMLEVLDVLLVEKLGTKWWIGTPLEKYARKR